MPELPEIRALAERLDSELDAMVLAAVQVLGFSGLKTVSPAPGELVGSTVASVTSRGKYLILAFDRGARLLAHLGNSGRLDLERPPRSTKPRGSMARLDFGRVAILLREHGSERRSGFWVLGPGDEGPLASLGPEPGEEAFGRLILEGDDRRHLHTLLRDQHSVAGIGRGYADDALNRAGLSPFAALSNLDGPARRRLLEAVRTTFDEALASERGRSGGLSESSLGDRFAVHRRAGSPCPCCSTRLERISYESHEVVYCPSCQTSGRVLADRRLSRLLR